jgi:short subunit fatty acids transporter
MATIAAFDESTEVAHPATPVATSNESHASQIHDGIRSIQNSNWWSLVNTISVVGLLAAAIICLMLPSLIQTTEPIAHSSIDMAVRGLVAMVLIFNVYAVRQQIRLKKLCEDMNKSVKVLGSR